MSTSFLWCLGILIILGTLVVIYRFSSAKKARVIRKLAEKKCAACGNDLEEREFQLSSGDELKDR